MLLVPWSAKLLAHVQPLVCLLASPARTSEAGALVQRGDDKSWPKPVPAEISPATGSWYHQRQVAEVVPRCIQCRGHKGSRRPFYHGV